MKKVSGILIIVVIGVKYGFIFFGIMVISFWDMVLIIFVFDKILVKIFVVKIILIIVKVLVEWLLIKCFCMFRFG